MFCPPSMRFSAASLDTGAAANATAVAPTPPMTTSRREMSVGPDLIIVIAVLLNSADSVRRRHHTDLRHHAPILVFENMTVVDELTELGERNVYYGGSRRTLALAPLIGCANAVLPFHDVWNVRDRHSQRDIILNDSTAGSGRLT